jgi:long-chain fatty acid transport protein
MKVNARFRLKLVLLVIMVSTPLTVFANGFFLPDQDAFATARGDAFVATADNASAIAYNPAGITQLEGSNIRATFYGIYVNPTFTPPGGGTTFYNQDHFAAVPKIFYTYTPKASSLSFGLGVYEPFGLSSSWPQNTGFRTLGTEGSVKYLTINPVVALKLAPNFSIGGGITVNYANVVLQQGILPFQTANDQFRFNGDGWGVGYNFGALWQPLKKLSFGFSFRGQTDITLDGQTKTIFPGVIPPANSPAYRSAQAGFSFPFVAIIGTSYRPTPDWNVEFDATYVDWNKLGTLTIEQSSSPAPPLIPKNVSVILDWQSSWLFELGATRYFGHGWQVSAGYVLNQNSVPNANYNPVVADLTRHFFSVGTGYKGKVFNFDVAYQLGYGPTHTVTGSAATPSGQNANGDYGFLSNAVLVTVGVHF